MKLITLITYDYTFTTKELSIYDIYFNNKFINVDSLLTYKNQLISLKR
jgi:hypothetical protein